MIYADQPIGMFFCPICGEMVVAGMPHPDYSLLNEEPIAMPTTTQGRRVYQNKAGGKLWPDDPHPGDYWRDEDTGVWMAYCPKGGIGALADHQVTEHEDGTITVSPSILMPGQWHGYLERGVWREV